MDRWQEQKAKELRLFVFCQRGGEKLLRGDKDRQGAPSPALSGWLPILSLLGGYLAMSFSSSVELACGPGGWCSEQEREDSQDPTGWGTVPLPA